MLDTLLLCLMLQGCRVGTLRQAGFLLISWQSTSHRQTWLLQLQAVASALQLSTLLMMGVFVAS